MKSLDLPQERENSSCLIAFKLRYWFSPAFGLELEHQLFLGLEAASFWTRTVLLALLGVSPAYRLTLQIL